MRGGGHWGRVYSDGRRAPSSSPPSSSSPPWKGCNSRAKDARATRPHPPPATGSGHRIGRSREGERFIAAHVNVGLPDYDTDKFVNLKAELPWSLRERVEEGRIGNLYDEKSLSQLSSIRYEYNYRGQLQIESKDTMRKAGSGSPDRGEAVMLAFAESPKLGLGDVDLTTEIRI